MLKHEIPTFSGTMTERQNQVEKWLKKLCEELNIRNEEIETQLAKINETVKEKKSNV